MNLEEIKESCVDCNHYCEECEMENACFAVTNLTRALYARHPKDWEFGDIAAIRVLEKSKEVKNARTD
ncbi:MAG: hypothetical protein RR053_08655 [Evtepia sp.]